MTARSKVWILGALALTFALDAFAATKDFKGLFGSYRREKFTENEGRPSDFGMDIMLSTLLPVSPFANSTEVRNTAGAPMAYATFFNVEASLFFTLSYHWEIGLNFGYFTYETRRQNTQDNTAPGSNILPGTPIFHLFELSAFPVLLGLKYRFSTSDIVPYLGVSAGLAYVRRRASYDYAPLENINFSMAPTAQATVGLQFFISPRTGIRLEVSGMYMGLAAGEFDSGATNTANFPIVLYQPSPIAMRYSSGLFVLF